MNGPVWTKKKQNLLDLRKNIIFPDSGNVGPILIQDEQQRSGSSLSTEVKSEDSYETASTRFKRKKHLNGKCPLTQRYYCSWPLNSGYASGVQIKQPDKQCQMYEHGSSLDVVQCQNCCYLVHSDCSYHGKSPVMVLSHLKCSDPLNDDEVKTWQPFKLEKKLELGNSAGAFQIIAKYIDDACFAITRSHESIQLERLNINTLQSPVALEERPVFIERQTHPKVTDITLHSLFPGWWSSVTENGTVKVYDSRVEKLMWETALNSSGSSENKWYACVFGVHPQTVLVANDNETWLCDARSGSNDVSTIFHLPQLSEVVSPFEKISAIHLARRFPFLYVACTDTVFLIDLRSCKVPVMTWSHMLYERPSLMTSEIISNTELIVVSNSREKKLAIFETEWNQVENLDMLWNESLFVPKHFRILEETKTFANKNGLWFSPEVQQRLSTRWCGLGSHSDSINNNHIKILLQNNCGDVFCQEFSYFPDPLELGLEMSSKFVEERAASALNKWEEQLMKLDCNGSSQVDGGNSLAEVYFDDIYKNFTCLVSNNCSYKSKYKKSTYKSVSNGSCKKNYSWDVRRTADVIYNRKFSSFSHDGETFNRKWVKTVSHHFVETWKSDTETAVSDSFLPHIKIPKFLKEKLTSDYLQGCNDSLGKRVLAYWPDGQVCQMDQQKSSFNYYSCPVPSSSLNHKPSKVKKDDKLSDTLNKSLTQNVSSVGSPEKAVINTSLQNNVIKSPVTECNDKPDSKSIYSSAMHKKKHRRVDGF